MGAGMGMGGQPSSINKRRIFGKGDWGRGGEGGCV